MVSLARPLAAFSRRLAPTWAVIVTLAPALACNQADPPGTTDDAGDTAGTSDTTDGTDTGNVGADQLYPLVHGAHWSYVAKTTQGQVLSMEEVDVIETTWNGQSAWLISDNPNMNGVWDESVLLYDGDLTLRVHREEMTDLGPQLFVDYDPGFPRAKDSWTTVGLVEEYLYDRTETDSNGQNPMTEPRGHQYTVLAVDEPVTVPAGTFNCVKIERVRTIGGAAGEIVTSWYAFGVGKIREERPADSRIEELASVHIPGGAVYP